MQKETFLFTIAIASFFCYTNVHALILCSLFSSVTFPVQESATKTATSWLYNFPEIGFCIFTLQLEHQRIGDSQWRCSSKRLINSKRDAERGKIQLIPQLCINNDEAKDLNLSIKGAISKPTAHNLELQPFGPAACNCTGRDGESFETLRESDHVKQQICRLKLDMAAALQEKAKAEAEIESSSASIKSYSMHAQKLRSDIEAANVKQVLTDMERIEVEKDFRNVQKQREVESVRSTKSIRKLTSKIAELRTQICSAKKLQAKLLITASNAEVLRNEMKAIRWLNHSASEDHKIQSLAMQATAAELKAAKKEMSSLNAEGFRLMNEMDEIRKQVIQIAERKQQSSKRKQDAEFSLQSLNAMLHQAICKLESAAAAENRAETIVATLSDAVDQLKADVEAAWREEEMVKQETEAVRNEAAETKLRAKELGERLHEAMAELKAVKALELKALKELKETTERTMRDRAISALWSSTITLSKSEYYYLVKEANEAQLVADKKLVAAQAWKEALEAEEREKWALVPVGGSRKDTPSKPNRAPLFVLKRNGKEVGVQEEGEEVDQMEIKLAIAMPRRSLTISGIPETTRRQRRRSFTSPTSSPRSKENGKVMAESFVKFIRGRRHQKKHSVLLRWIDRLPASIERTTKMVQ